MKRTLSLVLALIMVLGTFTGVFAAAVEVDTAADFLEEKGILLGANGDLMLENNLERRDAVVLLSRLLGVESEAKTFLTTEESPSFEDARTDVYYIPFIAWAEENGYFAGDDEGNFNPRNPITAQEYALVLARALEYDLNGHEPWAAALAIAEQLGLLEGVEVEDKDEVVRGDMAVMTFNTLNAKINGSDQTLAEKLGIEMPAEPKPEKLEVEVYTENLREIIVELNDASLVDEDDLLDDANYKIVKNTVERVTLDENKVIVELKENLYQKQSYELIIGGNDRALAGRYKFTAQDDVVPTVEKVEVLGEYGIKVTVSEPVDTEDTVRERYFLVDGKNIAMNVENYGRVLILTPYYSTSFPENAEELEIRGLVDHAGFKSSVQTFDIEVSKDEVAPEVTKVEIVADNVIEVTFDKDIYKDSVTGYDSRRILGNVSYGQGRHTVYSKQATNDVNYGNKIDLNKAQYVFDERLPRNVEITVEGVQNHSKVEMEAVTERAVEKIDHRQPVILDHDFTKLSDSKARFDLYFDKDVKIEKALADANHYFEVYVDTVANRNLQDVEITSLVYHNIDENVKYADVQAHNVIRVEIEGLHLNERPNYDYEYILEIKNFEDNTMLNNRMYVDYIDFELKPGTSDFEVTGMYIKSGKVETELSIYFSKAVDRVIAEDKTNYIFERANGNKSDVADLKGDIIVEDNGKTVTLVIKTSSYNNYKDDGKLHVLEVLKDKDGKRLANRETYDFELGSFLGLRDASYKALAAAITEAEAFRDVVSTAGDSVVELNKVIASAKTVYAYALSSEADFNKAIKALETEMAKDIYSAGKEAKMIEFFEGKGSEVKALVTNLSAKNETYTAQEFLNEAAKAILTELQDGAEELAKATTGKAEAKINGIDVVVTTKFDSAKNLEYTIAVGNSTSDPKVVVVDFVAKVYTLSFTHNLGSEEVAIVVYEGDVEVAAVDGEYVFAEVATISYVATAEGYQPLEKANVEIKKDEKIQLRFIEKLID